MVFQQRRQRRSVRFAATVQVREYALTVGDVSLCVATPYCPRMCRSHPLPLTLTDCIVRTYHGKLRETPGARLTLQTCETQMKRLLQYPGSTEDRMRVLTQLNIDLYKQRLRQSSTPPPMWDEKVLQARLGFDTTPVRVEILDDDDIEAQKIARPTGDPIIQEAIVKAVVASTKCPSKLYIHLQNSQSGSKHLARKKALSLENELYGRSGLSNRLPNESNTLSSGKRGPRSKKKDAPARQKANKDQQRRIKPPSGHKPHGFENILPRFLPKGAMWV